MKCVLLAFLVPVACHRDGKAEGGAHEEGGEAAEAAPFSVEHSASGEAIVVLTPEALEAAGVATANAAAREATDEVAAFGTLVADPSRVSVLRAPLAGTLAARDASSWPAVGSHVDAATSIGTLAPRTAPLTTAELADLQAKLAAARADEKGIQAELDAAKAALDRARKLNALDKGVSDQAVESAAALVTAGEAKLAAALASVAIFEKAAQASGALVLEPLPLFAPRTGEVIAVLAQPGESVEAGQEIARVADFTELLADVRLPLDRASGAAPTKARVVVNGGGAAAASLDAIVVGPSPESDALAPMVRLRVRAQRGGVRPGLGVTAWLESGGAPQKVLAVPASAVVRYASRSWVYVETGKGRFTRRAVTIVRTDGDFVLVSAGVDAGSKVVAVGAMTLLSQEQLAAGGGEEGE